MWDRCGLWFEDTDIADYFNKKNSQLLGFPGGVSGKESTCQSRRHKRCVFNLWVGKIPWRRNTHSSILAWKIPWTEEPGGLQSMGSQRFGQLVKEKEIKRGEGISEWEEKKVRKSKGEEQRKEKIIYIYNHILIINDWLEKSTRFIKSTVFSVIVLAWLDICF